MGESCDGTAMTKRGSLQARVAAKKRLAQLQPGGQRLGSETIMDRTLAQQYGVPYVHLAVFCVDVDRAYQVIEEDPTLPFGWEVFLSGCYVVTQLPTREDGGADNTLELLEAACLHVLDGDPAAAALGSQLTFAVHDAIGRGRVSELLRPVFRTWRGARQLGQLGRALDDLWADADRSLQRIALHCLSLPMQPPWAPPTLLLLERMARGEVVLDATPEGG